MIKINIGTKSYTLVSEYSEMTLSQLDKATSEMLKEDEPLLAWARVFASLSDIDRDEVLSWPLDDFVKIVNAMFNDPIEMFEEFEHKNVKYTRSKESKLTAGQSIVVQKAFNSSSTPLTEIMSSLCNVSEPTTLEDLPAHYAVGHLLRAGLRLVEDIKISTV